uniref:AMP-dependent synthetase/ligase domain-containing protein n=1 Tax=Pyrodinium bahamense TaxID=73915 RepID=A0A7S0FYH8_9DINO
MGPPPSSRSHEGTFKAGRAVPDPDGQSVMTMGRALSAVAGWKGEDIAITTTGPQLPMSHVSFRELEQRSDRMARAYASFKVEGNDFVAIMLPTGVEFVVVSFACWKLGATPSNVGSRLTFREREEIVRLATPSLVAGVPSFKDPQMRIHEGTRCLPEGFEPGPDMLAEPLPDRVASSWLVATSGGSTGRPKLIALAEPSLVTMRDLSDCGKPVMLGGFSTLGGGVAEGVDLVPAPLSHNAPFHCAMHGVLSASHQVLLTKFDAERALQLVEECRCTFAYLVPTMMKRIWDLPIRVREKYNVSSLHGVFHMAAPCPRWLKEVWCHWLGPEIIWELYGPTEAIAWTLINGVEWMSRPKLDGLNLVGKAKVGELRILHPETRAELPPRNMGEVWMRHHERRITYCYYGATSVRDADGWETVGDMGAIDEDGYLHLGDRRKDMVLVGGANIYPAEIEAVLEEHPAVKSAVVVGLPDADLGQALHGVLFTGGDTATSEELQLFLKERLESKKVPRQFTWAEDHLRGDDGKCRRAEVASWVLSRIEAHKVPPTSKL